MLSTTREPSIKINLTQGVAVGITVRVRLRATQLRSGIRPLDPRQANSFPSGGSCTAIVSHQAVSLHEPNGWMARRPHTGRPVRSRAPTSAQTANVPTL